jgi:hypothetical protein
VFENRVHGTTLEPNIKEIMVGRTKFHNEEIHALKLSPNITTAIKLRRGGQCSTRGKIKNTWKFLDGKSGGI